MNNAKNVIEKIIKKPLQNHKRVSLVHYSMGVESLVNFSRCAMARVISKIAHERWVEFQTKRNEMNDDDVNPRKSLYELEHDWHYGWFCKLAWLMERGEYLAFFALLGQVDTIVQEQVLFRIKQASVCCYETLFFWPHTYLGDAASLSYQHWRSEDDAKMARHFEEKLTNDETRAEFNQEFSLLS